MLSLLASTTAAATPAGGAAADEVVLAAAFGAAGVAVLLLLILGHRSGRLGVLDRLGAFAGRVSGLPPWAALPLGIAAGSLLVALLGMYWDISLHVDNGRDPGPLANPAHYLILVGLFGTFAAGTLALSLAKDVPGPAAGRISDTWHVPVGGLLLCACGTFALLGFPLDDLWHRLFGQDVTLWGPTHLMLFGGAGLSLIGLAVLMAEGKAAVRIAKGALPGSAGRAMSSPTAASRSWAGCSPASRPSRASTTSASRSTRRCSSRC